LVSTFISTSHSWYYTSTYHLKVHHTDSKNTAYSYSTSTRWSYTEFLVFHGFHGEN
jgi:hypothetical protein